MMGHGYLPRVSPGAHVVLEGAWDSGAPEVRRQKLRGQVLEEPRGGVMGRVVEKLGATLEIALNAGYGIRDTGYGLRVGEIRGKEFLKKSDRARYSLNNADDV